MIGWRYDELRFFTGNGNGTFNTGTVLTGAGNAFITSDFNGDGNQDVLVRQSTGRLGTFLGTGGGAFTNGSAVNTGNPGTETVYGTAADFNKDGVMDIVAPHGAAGTIGIALGTVREGISALQDFSLRTQDRARSATTYLSSVSERIIRQRGEIGAFLSRIDIAAHALQSRTIEFQAAEARITNADIAEEASQLIALTIAQQTAAAILAQANLAPALVLKLLK